MGQKKVKDRIAIPNYALVKSHSFRKTKLMKRFIFNKSSFVFHGVLKDDFRLKPLNKMMFMLFHVESFDQKISNFGKHMLLAVGVLLFLYLLARTRQSDDFIIALLRHL